MYSSNGCSSKMLVLQKMFWTKFGPAFPIIHSSITIIWDTLSELTRQHIIAHVKHFTSDRHLYWLHSKKIKFSTSQRYNIVLLCGSVNTVNTQCNLCVLHQGLKGILENMTQAISPVSKCHMTMIV